MKVFWSLIGAVVVGFPTIQVQAQPFGLNMGDSLKKLESQGIQLSPIDHPYTYRTRKLPYGNSLFNDYWLTITPKAGLCRINAWGDVRGDDPYGSVTQQTFSGLSDAMTRKYGPSKKFDFIRSDGIWNASREWMMSLVQKERTLASFWDRQNGSNMPPEMLSVMIEAKGVSSSSSLILASYEYKNLDQCNSEKDSAKSGNL